MGVARLSTAAQRVITAASFMALLVACSSGPATAPTQNATTQSPTQVQSSRTFAADQLPQLVLKPGEAPKGTLLRESDRGDVSLDEFWSCCKKQRELFVSAGFQAAQRIGFEATSLPEDPTKWEPGVAFARSVAVLFADAKGASTAMKAWQDFFTASAIGELKHPALSLGDESSAVNGIFYRKGERLIIYFWRIGNAVLHVRIGGRDGTISEADVDPLAKAMNARATR